MAGGDLKKVAPFLDLLTLFPWQIGKLCLPLHR